MKTTGVGSLPFTDVDEALRYSLAHDVPFLPELPKLDPAEFMIPAALEGFAAGVPDLRMLERFLGALSSPRLIKLQMAGPTTLVAFGKDVGRAEVVPWLVLRARTMIAAARSRGHEVLFVLDEPALVSHAPFGLDVLVPEVRATGAKVGLHCCGETSWAALLPLGLDALSFDAALSLASVRTSGFSGLQILGVHRRPSGAEDCWCSTPCGLALSTPAHAWRAHEALSASTE